MNLCLYYFRLHGFRFITLLCLALFCFSLTTQQVFGMTREEARTEQRRVFNKKIGSFEVATCGTGGATGSTVDVLDLNLEGKDNAEKAILFFAKPEQGFTLEQAAGIVGNFIEESGVDPERVEDGPYSGGVKRQKTVPPARGPDGQPGYGIAQWTSPGRKVNLREFGKNTVHTLSTQLQFVMHEMDNYPGLEARLKDMKGDGAIADVAFEFHKVYEGSRDTPAMIQERVESGKRAYARLSGQPSGDSAPLIPAPESSSACIGGSNDASGGGGQGYTPIEFENKDELVRKILDHKDIKFGNYQDAGVQRRDVQSCLTETTLVALLAMADQSGAVVPINAMGSDHGGCSGGKSFHNQGRAIDIGYYGNGDSRHKPDGDKLYKYLFDNATELKINELFWIRPPSGYKCIDASKPLDCSALPTEIINTHHHHIHVGFN